MKIGISYREFWHTNPHIINLLAKNHTKKEMEIDEQMHNFGYYIMSAVANSIGMAFNGRKHKSFYPNEPMFKKAYEESLLSEEELYEIELKKALAAEEAWVANGKLHGLPETNA